MIRTKHILLVGLITLFSHVSFAAVFNVTNNLDAGNGSLRDAITNANGSLGPHVINFSNLTSPTTIVLESALPKIIQQMNIDGTTVGGYMAGTSLVTLQAFGLNYSGHGDLLFPAPNRNYIFRFEPGSANSSIHGLRFLDSDVVGGSMDEIAAVNIGEANNIEVYDNIFGNDLARTQIFAAVTIDQGTNCNIHNNLVKNSGHAFWTFGNCTGTNIHHNTLENINAPSIQMLSTSNLLIEYNFIRFSMEYIGIKLWSHACFIPDGEIMADLGVDNTIRYNDIIGCQWGIYIESTEHNTKYNLITENQIYQIGAKAIELNYPWNTGVPDPSSGGNCGPILSRYSGNIGKPMPVFDPIITPFNGLVTGTAQIGDKIELFEGTGLQQANNYLGSTITNGSGNWSINVGVVSLPYLAATATDENNSNQPGSNSENTSELVSVILPLSCSSYNIDATFTIPTSFICVGEDIGITTAVLNPTADCSPYTISWDFGDGSPVSPSPVHAYNSPGGYTITYTVICADGTLCTSSQGIEVVVCPCCNIILPTPGISTNPLQNIGHFYIDNGTGQIVYQNFNCPALHAVNCIRGSIILEEADDVISSSMVVLSDNWVEDPAEFYNREKLYPTDPNVDPSSLSPNIFETGEANKWRVKKTFVYREKIDQNGQDKNYNRGTFPITMFDWKNETNNDVDKWVNTSNFTNYSPNGQPEEDENILKIKSTAQYGNNGTLQTLVAQNADKNSVSFENFENLYPTYSTPSQQFENGLVYNTTFGLSSTDEYHTGKTSVKLKSMTVTDAFDVGTVKLSSQIMSEGLMIRTWVKVDKNKVDLIISPTVNKIKVYYRIGVTGTWTNQVDMHKVSDAGEWTLFEAFITSGSGGIPGVVGDIISLGIHVDEIGTTYSEGDIFIDDFRAQPMHSEMACYVYDEAQRLTAVFDDQHFALIYQYNAEGILIRKKKETIRGIKTISETQYNSKGINR